MKAKELIAAIALPSQVASRSLANHPITGHIAFAGGKVSAFNLVAAAEVKNAEVPDLGCCVPADRLNNALAAIAMYSPDADVKLAMKGKTLAVTAPHVRYSMPTMPADTMPAPKWPEGFSAIADWSSLVSALRFCVHAAAVKDINRPFLCGVATREGYMAASDGHRGAMVNGQMHLRDDLIIPTDHVRPICDLPKGTGYATNENAISIEFEGGRFYVPLVAAKFPDMKRIVPVQHADDQAQLERAALDRTLGAFLKTKSEKWARITLEQNLLVIEDQSEDVGTRMEVNCVYSGAKQSFGLDGKYFYDSVQNLDGPHVTMSVKPSETRAPAPVLLTGKSEGRKLVIQQAAL